MRAATYERISQDRESTEHGVDNQRSANLALAARLGFDVVSDYRDNDTGASTRSRKARPGYAAMLAAAKRGEFEAILAYSNSRLTRRPREFEDLIELHEQYGIRIVTVVSGDDDLSTADGRMVARIKAAADAAEAERTGERVAFAQAAKLRRGEDIGGRRPFGFEADRITIRESEATLIREGVRMILGGASLYAVARAWDAAGIREKPWRSQTVRDILTRPRNTGRLVVGGVEYGRGDRPAILTDEEYADLLAVLRTNERPRRGRKPQTSTAVSVVRCGVCGAGVELTIKSGGVRTIRCSVRGGGQRHPTMTDDRLEMQLAQVALMRVVDPFATENADRPEVAKLRRTLADVTTRRDRAREDVEAYDDPDDRAHARKRVTELTAAVREARAALDAALAENVASRARHLVDVAHKRLGGEIVAVDPFQVWPQWVELWRSWPVADRRELLRGRLIELMPHVRGESWRLRVDGKRPAGATQREGEPI